MLFCSSLSQSSDSECHYRYRFSYLASLYRVFIVPKLKCDLSGVPNYGSSYTKTTELYRSTEGPESTRGPLQRAQPSGVGNPGVSLDCVPGPEKEGGVPQETCSRNPFETVYAGLKLRRTRTEKSGRKN